MSVFSKMKGYFFDEVDPDYSEDVVEAVEEDVSLPQFEQPVEKPSRRAKVVPMASPAPVQTPVTAAAGMKMVVYQPMSYEDAQNIVDNLRARKPVIVNMVDLERECAQRVVDFIAGAVYALNGTIRKVSFGIFVIVPSNVSLVGNGEDDAESFLNS